MILKQLIGHSSWLNIEAALLQEYPTAQKRLFAYEAVYHQLLLLQAGETDLQLELKRASQTGTNGNTNDYVDICGKRQTPHVADVEICIGYALDFMPWAEWLSMPVSAKTLQSFSEPEIVAHCLWGMTYYAFDEDAIQARATNMSHELDALDSMTEDEKQTQLISWNQLKEQPGAKAK